MAIVVGNANPNPITSVANANPAPITSVGNAAPAPITSVGNSNGSQVSSLLPGATQPAVTPPAATGQGNTSGVAATPAVTPVSQETIDAIMQSIAGAVANNQSAFNNATTLNRGADAQDQTDYNNQVQNNTENRARAVQNTEQAAAQGNQGLKAVLASLGALNGTGQVLAGRAVADSANTDIGTSDNTFQNNATAIQGAQSTYDNAAKARDNALQTALNTDNQNAHVTGIQSILNDAQTQGDVPTYQKFLPQLVQADTTPTQSLAANPLVFNPATVNSFAPTSGLNVTSAPAVKAATTPVNSALYVNKQR
jgi:hypothetical protein